jgi:YVTN family beta-propeller protein
VGERPYAVVHVPLTGKLMVTNQGSNTVTVLDPVAAKPVQPIAVGEYPEGIALHPDGQQVYVVNWFDSTVSVIDAVTMQVTATVPVGKGSRGFGNFFSQLPEQQSPLPDMPK